MKKFIMSMVAVAALSSGSVMAQSLPAGFSVGVGADYVQNTAKHSTATANTRVSLGYDYNKYISTEVDVGGVWATNKQKAGQSVVVDFKVGMPVNLAVVTVKPYVLVGTGYGFSQNHSNETTTSPIYNVGAGVVFPVTTKIDLDVRYTYVDSYNKPNRSANAVGLNVAYKF